MLVGVSRAGISLAAALVFGLPLGFMLAFAAVAQALWGTAFAGAAAGLAGGGVLALLLARRAGMDDWVDPVLVEIRAGRMPAAGDTQSCRRQGERVKSQRPVHGG